MLVRMDAFVIARLRALQPLRQRQYAGLDAAGLAAAASYLPGWGVV
jgi:hypothetical protein